MNFFTLHKKTRTTFEKHMPSFGYPAVLAIFVLLLVRLILPNNSLFGSEGDWLSQHIAVAEQLRTAFLETGKILPDWLPLGGGSSGYDFSYYGFLRPDVLISYFLPQTPMSYIISGYAIAELVAGALLCYFWLKRNVSMPFFAFLGAALYSCAGCFYHAHRQIMFVNYMPFLILALWGIEKLFETGRIRMLVISLLMVCLHSFYFAPAVLVVCAFYFLHCLKNRNYLPNGGSGRIPVLCRFSVSLGLALGMAAILLLPTFLDLLSTSKDAGAADGQAKIFSLTLNLQGLLYHPYGCGLTILCLYTLILSIRRKSTRMLSVLVLICLSFNLCSYVLSGFLYVRYKVLIPFVPLLILVCVQTLEALISQKESHSLLLGILCLVPALFSRYPLGVLADGLWIFFSFLLIQKNRRAKEPTMCSMGRTNRNFTAVRRTKILCLLLCVPSVCLFVFSGRSEDYVSASDQRQELLASNTSADKTRAPSPLSQDYRFECLTEPFANVNTRILPGLGKTSMYSSITDRSYADFYYHTMKNPIRIRNRVALMTDANPFFSYLMGIRYIQADRSRLPLGYVPVAKVTDSTVIAENTNVLPLACTSTSFMSQKEFAKLSFPYTLEAITQYTIIPETENEQKSSRGKSDAGADSSLGPLSANAMTAEKLLQTSKITPLPLKDLLAPSSQEALERHADTRLSLPISEHIHTKLLILSANVTSLDGAEVTIDINQIRNKLSGTDAPYPNNNNTFTWILSSNEQIRELEIVFSKGDYRLSGWQAWTMDTSAWGNPSVKPLEHSAKTSSFKKKQREGSMIVSGQASLDRSGCLVTSLPFRKGYRAYVNGKKVNVTRINETFVGIPLKAGSYEVSIFYCPPGKTISFWISLASLAFFVSWELLCAKETAAQRKPAPSLRPGIVKILANIANTLL